MRSNLAAAAIGGIVLLSAGAASASVITSSSSLSLAMAPFSESFTLAQFDPSLGTLTGVELSVGANSLANVEVYNPGSTTGNFTNAYATLVVTTTTAGSYMVTETLTAIQPSGSVAPGSFSGYSGLTATDSGSIDIPASAWSLYEGTGTVSPTFVSQSNGQFGGTTADHLFFGGSAEAGGTATITYTYDPTPTAVSEPRSLALLGTGLLALGIVVKRRRVR
jgi:hypothetical protein